MQRSYPCAQGRAGVGSLLASQQQASLLRRNLLTIASRESHGKSARKRRGSSHVPRRPLMPSHSLPIMLSSVPPSSAGDPEYQPPDPAPPPFPDPTEPQPTPNEPELPPSQPPPGATGRRRQGRAGERRPIPATGAADARGHPSLAAGWLPAIEWRGRRAPAGRLHLHRTLRRVPRRLRLRRVRAGWLVWQDDQALWDEAGNLVNVVELGAARRSRPPAADQLGSSRAVTTVASSSRPAACSARSTAASGSRVRKLTRSAGHPPPRRTGAAHARFRLSAV